MSTSLDLENLVVLVGNVDADLDEVVDRDSVTGDARDHIRSAQEHLRLAHGALGRARDLRKDADGAARPDAAAAQ